MRQEAESENPTILRVTWLPSRHGGDFFPAEMTNIILPHYSSCAFLLSCSVTSLGVHTNCSSYISCFLFLAKRDYCFSNCNLLKYSCCAPTFFDMDLWKNNVYTTQDSERFFCAGMHPINISLLLYILSTSHSLPPFLLLSPFIQDILLLDASTYLALEKSDAMEVLFCSYI